MVREKNEKGIEKVILGLVCLKLVSLFLVWQLLRVDSFSRSIAQFVSEILIRGTLLHGFSD